MSEPDILTDNLESLRKLIGAGAAGIPEWRLAEIAGDPVCIWILRRLEMAEAEIARLTDALIAAIAQTDQAVTHLRAVAEERDALVLELAGVRRDHGRHETP